VDIGVDTDTAGVQDELRGRLQAALGAAYALERELGGGGMSRVFVAEDARLARRVVVKVLAPELTAGMSAERFEREIRLAARLQHPNVVPVIAAGERGGLAYFVMPYVEGESLRRRLTRDGRLPVDAAVSVLRDVARALEYAHAHGVVHRDVKPDNVLLTGSAAAVADFGIAKALHLARTKGTAGAARAAGTGAPETLTRAGTSLGTPAYMAPEQAAGDPATDHRADLYAWGVVAYELLAGAPPFSGRPAHQLVAAHIAEAPPPLAAQAPDAPPALAGLVMRCLAKDPARRPQSAGELLAALEAARTPSGPHAVAPPPAPRRRVRAAAGLLAALVLVAAVALLRARRPSAPAPPLLVVLPFENLGPAADAYFADGLTEEVRGRLASVAGLRVIGGASARQYRGTTKPAHQIARELGATHLLTATVRWERAPGGGGRVRISPELVRAADQATVWAEPYEGPLTDVFEVQARAAERVAGALDLAFDVRRPDALAAAPTPNPSAYDQYLRGLALEQRSYFGAASWAAVVEAYGRAVALDPRFGLAWARLAGARAQGWTTEGQSDGAVLGLARAALDSARRLAPGAPDTHVAAARLAFAADRDYAEAVAQMRAAVRARPGDASLLAELGWRLVEAQDTAGPGLEEGLGISRGRRSSSRSNHRGCRRPTSS
jgi:serine/threonine-protein kinase